MANAGQGESNRRGRAAAGTRNGRGIENIHRLLFERMSSAVAIGETLFDQAGKPIDYRIIEVNPAYERLTGQKAEQVVGMHAFGVNPQLRPELIERLNRVAVSGQSEEFEGHHAETDRSVRIRLSRVGPTWVMAMIEDVTDRRRAESAMRDRSAFVETILTGSAEGLVVFDLDLRYVVWNPRMEEMTGLPADRVLGRRARDIYPAVMAAGIEENLRRVIETGQPQSREFEYTIPQTGRGGWSLNTHRPHRDASGHIIGVIASVRDITARHDAEEALRQSEEQFHVIFDSMGDGVAISEPGGNFLEVNRVLCQRLGYTREQLLATPVGAINSPASAATIPKRVEAMLRGGRVRPIEATHVRRDGTEIPVEAVSRRIEFRGRPAILTVYRDLTERRRSEEAVREQARLMQQLLDAIPIPIIAHYADGRAPLSNAAYASGPGRPRDGMVSRSYGELNEADVEMHAAHNRPVLEQGAVETYEANLYSPDGTVRRQLLTKAPLRSSDDEITGIVTVGLDISDRYRAEQELSQSEERFRTLFENAGDALLIVDEKGRFLDANRAACERLGYTRDELVTMSAYDIDTPEFAAGLEDRMALLLERGILSFESAHVARDGTVIPTEITATTIVLDGKTAVLSVARDLTERRRAEAERIALENQLRQAQKVEEIGRLAGGIAHDFNNLVTVISGNADLALAQLPPGEGPREYLEQIKQASDRAAELTGQLLAYARQTVRKPEVVDLSAAVRRLEPMLQRLIREDVKLVTIAPSGIGRALADPGQIDQVILNLAVNASEAMPDGGTLTIEIAEGRTSDATGAPIQGVPAGPLVALSVTDTGVGMDDKTVAHLFEPFFTTKDPGKGTGLGLATVDGIVRMSGGTVAARSQPGRGSTFTVYLPAVEAPIEDEPKPQPTPATRGAMAGTILLVEDDKAVRKLASRFLEMAGYRVVTAEDGPAALETARDTAVQLLLTDIRMPGMSGREVATRLAAIQPGIRVVYMSGHTDVGIVRDGVLETGIDFVAKPFTYGELISTVDAALSAPPGKPAAAEDSAG